MEPLNAKGRPFSWSYSALNDFEGCPLRYAHAKFYCTTPFQDTEAIRWGNRVHKAAEDTLKGNKCHDTAAFEPVKPYVRAMLNTPHKVEAEVEVALTRDFKQVKWFSKYAWLRVKIDVVITKIYNSVMLYDWKTGGKIKDDEDQLRICAAALSTIRPEIKQFGGKYIWTKHMASTGIRPLSKDEIPGIWAEFLPRVRRMEQAWASENFPARPSGLCPWCSVEECVQRRGERR